MKIKIKIIAIVFFSMSTFVARENAKADYAATVNYSCPNGGSLSGDTCVKVATSYYSEPIFRGLSKNGAIGFTSPDTCSSNNDIVNAYNCKVSDDKTCIDDFESSNTYGCNQGTCKNIAYFERTVTCTSGSSYAAAVSYSCPSGGSLSGAMCLAQVNGVCGSSNGQALASTPTENFCSDPASFTGLSGTGPWFWSCLGRNGGSTVSCGTSAPAPINGACGTSNGQVLTTAPTTNLCQVTNSPTTVLGTGPWSWSCTGVNGGTNAACSASKFIPPACSSVNGNSYSAADFDQYKFYGDPNGDGTINISDAIAVMSNSSLCTPAKCDVDGNGLINITDALAIMRMANGTQTTRLCDSGMQTNLTGSGPWNWKCGNIDCSAQLPPVIPPVCTPNYTCTLQPTGNVCDASNVGQTIITQTDQCNDTNACSTPTKQTCIANGVSCNHPDETITCPALREGTDWKEVSP